MRLQVRILSAVVIASMGAASCARGQTNQYPSSTSVTASASHAAISGTITTTWNQAQCYPNDGSNPYSYSTTVSSIYGNTYIPQAGLPTNGSFSSANNSTFFGPGTFTITGTFSGFNGHNESEDPCSVTGSSGSTNVVIPPPVDSFVTLTPPASPVREGQTVTINVAVTGNYNYGPVPTGNVVLFHGSTILGTAAIQNIPGALVTAGATFNLSSKGIPPGTYSITAAYNGDSNLVNASSSSANVTISAPQVSTATALAIAPIPVTSGQTATLTATVTPSVSGITPTGTVTFFYGSRSLGTATLNSQGAATLMQSTAGIPGGNYAVTAHYAGDAFNFASTSPAVTATVQNATTTTLAVTPMTVPSGQSVTFTATVTRTPAGGPPSGKVNFLFSSYTFASATLDPQGVATVTFSTKNLGAGSYPITATYTGDPLDVTSTSTPVNITVQ